MIADKDFYILAINPGSTSTKIGLFKNDDAVFTEVIRHDHRELGKYSRIMDQKEYRKENAMKALERKHVDLRTLSAVVARGGLLRPLKSGVYAINERMIADLQEAARGEHASNCAAPIAYEIASALGIPSFIVDPVSVDEMEDVARISGLEGIERGSLSHALNTKAVARRYAREIDSHYSELNLIVAHLGGGISISAHRRGRMIDVSNPREEGPFSAERAGSLPVLALAQLCFKPNMNFKKIEKMVFTEGGLCSYLGTKDLKRAREMADSGDKKAKNVLDAMVYQISKEIGSMAAVLKGSVDAIIITGGMAFEPKLVDDIRSSTSFLGKVIVYPGEDELQALAAGALRVLNGEESSLPY